MTSRNVFIITTIIAALALIYWYAEPQWHLFEYNIKYYHVYKVWHLPPDFLYHFAVTTAISFAVLIAALCIEVNLNKNPIAMPLYISGLFVASLGLDGDLYQLICSGEYIVTRTVYPPHMVEITAFFIVALVVSICLAWYTDIEQQP